MQQYHESVDSGADWFEITRRTLPGEHYSLRFTLQRVPERLLRISFRPPRAWQAETGL